MKHFLARHEIRKLNKFDNVYLLVSGGLDSTYTTLNLYSLKFWIKKPVILLHANTYNQMRSSQDTLRKLREFVSPEWQYEEFFLN